MLNIGDQIKTINSTQSARDDSDERDELLRRQSNQEAQILTNKELEILKRKILSACFTSHGTDVGAFFDTADKDRSGTIDITELSNFVKKLIPKVNHKQLTNLLKAVDQDGSGLIERNEFIEFIEPRKSPTKADVVHFDGRSESPSQTPLISVRCVYI